MRITCDTKDKLPLSDLTEFQGGLKKRTDGDIKKIEKSINDYGFATPFFVWKNEGKNKVLDGHGRFAALKKCSRTARKSPALPVVYIDCPNEEAAKNLLLRICSTYGEMTAESVRDFLGGLEINPEEIKLPDGLLDLSAVLQNDDTKGDDDAPAVREDEPAQSKTGEIYELGRHRLICGDSTDTAILTRLMGDSMADLIITDPPYNVDYTGKTEKKLKIDNDKKASDAFRQFLANAYRAMFAVTKAGGCFYIFYAQTNSAEFINALQENGIRPHSYLIWVKNALVLSYSDYKWKHEPILYGWKSGGSHSFYGALNCTTVMDDRINPEKMSKGELIEYVKLLEARENSDVLYENKPPRNAEHPTMKPVELLERLIRNSSKADDIILDPFGGSGSTLIAAEKTGRMARLCELDPHYCDVIRRRYTKWAKENGRTVGTGGLE